MTFNDVRPANDRCRWTRSSRHRFSLLSLVNRTHLYDCEIGSILIVLHMLRSSMSMNDLVDWQKREKGRVQATLLFGLPLGEEEEEEREIFDLISCQWAAVINILLYRFSWVNWRQKKSRSNQFKSRFPEQHGQYSCSCMRKRERRKRRKIVAAVSDRFD